MNKRDKPDLALFSGRKCEDCGCHLLRDGTCLNGCHLDAPELSLLEQDRLALARLNARARCARR